MWPYMVLTWKIKEFEVVLDLPYKKEPHLLELTKSCATTQDLQTPLLANPREALHTPLQVPRC